MDGHFVPNLSMGPPIINSLRRVTHLPLEAHLMISNPNVFVDDFAQAGTDSFLVHWEGNNDLSRTVQSIKALGKRVGVAFRKFGRNIGGSRSGTTSSGALAQTLRSRDAG
jgi:ribulose-phosphate 3-epimerase